MHKTKHHPKQELNTLPEVISIEFHIATTTSVYTNLMG